MIRQLVQEVGFRGQYGSASDPKTTPWREWALKRGYRSFAVFSFAFFSNVNGVRDKKMIQCDIRDSAEPKQAEEKVRESEDRYPAFFTTSQDCVYFGKTEKEPAGIFSYILIYKYYDHWSSIEYSLKRSAIHVHHATTAKLPISWR
jgi:hypothetical protein